MPKPLFEEARVEFEGLRFAQAIELLEGGIQASTNIADAESSVLVGDCWLLLAQCYLWNGAQGIAKDVVTALNTFGGPFNTRHSDWLIRCILAIIKGEYRIGFDVVHQWIEGSVSAGDFDICEPLLYRGVASLRLGLLDQAEDDFSGGFAIGRLMASARLQAEHANYLGFTLHTQGRYRSALDWYCRSMYFGQAQGHKGRIGVCGLNLGICHYRLGNYTESLDQLTTALAMLQDAGDRLNECRARIALANVFRWLRDFAASRQHLAQAYTIASELQAPREECLALEFLGDVFRDEGKYEEARRYYRRGMAIAETLAPDGDLVLELRRREGECLLAEGRTGAGLEALARALVHARKLGDRGEEGVVLRCLAQGFGKASEFAKAISYAEQACLVLDQVEARHEHAIARIVWGEILRQMSSARGEQEPRDLLDRAWEQTVIAQGILLKLDIEHWTDEVKQLQSRIAKRRAEELKFQAESASGGRSASIVGPDETRRRPSVIAESRAMKEIVQTAAAFAPYDETVLLTGDTGTGKELIAQLLHQQSRRKDRPLIAVNVTAVPQSTFEREFFGHARGAFSGADSDRGGLAAAAHGGTLFLDEIGELPLETQVKLLRLLQDGCYLRLGDPIERRADLRIIAATNTDLEKAVAAGRFREDLYYRLAVLTIHLPPLRERPEDILPLLEHYLSVSERRAVTVDQYFNELSRRLLVRHDWPGNVREIIQVARRAYVAKLRHGSVEVVLGSGEEAMILSGPGPLAAAAVAGGQEKAALSRAHVLLALEECQGNRTEAARMLGVSRSSLYRRLEKLGLD